MRIVSWNLDGARIRTEYPTPGSRHESAWSYLVHDLSPDIGLLQEVVPPPWLDEHYSLSYDKMPGSNYGSAVIVKRSFDYRESDLLSDCRYLPVSYAGAVRMLEIGDPELVVVSVHALANRVPEAGLTEGYDGRFAFARNKAVWHISRIFDDLVRVLPGNRFVAGGDLNAARKMDDTFGSGNRGFFSELEELGFCECVYTTYGREVSTWFKGTKRDYQNDHLFCDAKTIEQLTSCAIREEAVHELRFSDHAPIVAEFELALTGASL